jgi:mRNA-degrading endonuclease RelE of RelBE toxin-antitoxin system
MFTIVFTESALIDLQHFKKAERKRILDAIEVQLTAEPLKPTRNRKPLRPNNLSTWESRITSHRVFYDVDASAQEVTVKAVGWKEHNRLFIRGQEHEL